MVASVAETRWVTKERDSKKGLHEIASPLRVSYSVGRMKKGCLFHKKVVINWCHHTK